MEVTLITIFSGKKFRNVIYREIIQRDATHALINFNIAYNVEY